MPTPDPITTHADDGIDRLIEHYSGTNKPVLYGLIRSLVGGYQSLEDCTWQVIWGRLLDPAPGRSEQAIGVQLDILGKIVGRGREGLDDTTYREAIRLQILVNGSFGTPDDLLTIARTAVGLSGTFTYREYYYLCMYFYLTSLTVPIAIVLFRALQGARVGGGRAIMEYYTNRISGGTLMLWANGATGGHGGFANGTSVADGGKLTSMQG